MDKIGRKTLEAFVAEVEEGVILPAPGESLRMAVGVPVVLFGIAGYLEDMTFRRPLEVVEAINLDGDPIRDSVEVAREIGRVLPGVLESELEVFEVTGEPEIRDEHLTTDTGREVVADERQAEEGA